MVQHQVADDEDIFIGDVERHVKQQIINGVLTIKAILPPL
jgi:hypothetical protein